VSGSGGAELQALARLKVSMMMARFRKYPNGLFFMIFRTRVFGV